jgi:hypothetical protein
MILYMYLVGIQWVSQFTSFYPMDENFTKIWDSLGSHLKVPYFRKAPIEGLYPTCKERLLEVSFTNYNCFIVWANVLKRLPSKYISIARYLKTMMVHFLAHGNTLSLHFSIKNICPIDTILLSSHWSHLVFSFPNKIRLSKFSYIVMPNEITRLPKLFFKRTF